MKTQKNKKGKSNNLEIGVCCKTRKEHEIMLTLIVYIQHLYNKNLNKAERISLRRLVEVALKELEARGCGFYPFPKK